MNEPVAPLIGTFKTPLENKERLPRKEEEVPLPAELAEKKTEEKVADEPPKSRTQTYEEGLARVKLTKSEARLIMDTLLSNGYYEESEKLGRLTVKIRTRNYQDTLRAQRTLELEQPQYPMSVNEILARYNVAASISAYGATVFVEKDDPEKAFQERLDFLMKLPGIVFQKLHEMVFKFDQKINAVFADGAPEDF